MTAKSIVAASFSEMFLCITLLKFCFFEVFCVRRLIFAGDANFFFHGHLAVPALEVKLDPDAQPCLVFKDSEYPKKPFLQWSMKTDQAYGVVDEGTYVHIFQLSPGGELIPISKVQVEAQGPHVCTFCFDDIDPKLKFRFKYYLSLDLHLPRRFTLCLQVAFFQRIFGVSLQRSRFGRSGTFGTAAEADPCCQDRNFHFEFGCRYPFSCTRNCTDVSIKNSRRLRASILAICLERCSQGGRSNNKQCWPCGQIF